MDLSPWHRSTRQSSRGSSPASNSHVAPTKIQQELGGMPWPGLATDPCWDWLGQEAPPPLTSPHLCKCLVKKGSAYVYWLKLADDLGHISLLPPVLGPLESLPRKPFRCRPRATHLLFCGIAQIAHSSAQNEHPLHTVYFLINLINLHNKTCLNFLSFFFLFFFSWPIETFSPFTVADTLLWNADGEGTLNPVVF